MSTLYATTAEENDPLYPKPLSELPNDAHAQLLQNRIAGSAARKGVDLLGLRPRLDALVVKIREMETHGDPWFWEMLGKPITTNEVQANFPGMWFSGLTHVEVAAATVLRYLQAEVWMERLVAERCGIPGISPPPRAEPAMPPFHEHELPARSGVAVKNMLYLYRREILRDKKAPKPEATIGDRSKNTGERPINKAKKFLLARGQRALNDDKGDINSPKRTFYLIDVIPEARLLR